MKNTCMSARYVPAAVGRRTKTVSSVNPATGRELGGKAIVDPREGLRSRLEAPADALAIGSGSCGTVKHADPVTARGSQQGSSRVSQVGDAWGDTARHPSTVDRGNVGSRCCVHRSWSSHEDDVSEGEYMDGEEG